MMLEHRHIAGLKNKHVPQEFNEESPQVYKLRKEVEPYKNAEQWQNTAIPNHGYESEDARGKVKKNLKRKGGLSNNVITLKRSGCQQPDSIADKAIQMEYCNIPNPLTVSSREYQHTLVPITLTKRFAEKNDASNKAYTSDTCNTEDITPTAYRNTLSINPRLGGQGGGDGNESDEDREQGKYHSQCKHKVSLCSQKEEYVSKQSEMDLKNQELNNVLCRVYHTYNTHQKGNCTLTQETKKFVENNLAKLCLESDIKHSSVSGILVSHSIQCENESCKVPVCSDTRKQLKEDSETSSLDEEEYYENTWEVLYSNTAFVESDSKIKFNEIFNILYEQKTGKGAFGEVNLTCLSINNVQALMVIKKISPKGKEGLDIDNMVKCLREIGQHKFLLTPDVILSTVRRDVTLLVMEKGLMSLNCYMKKTLHQHGRECQKVQGRTYDHIGVCNSGISAELCSYYFVQVASAVNYLHDFDYVHGDIKSENVMLMPGLMHVKIIDFDFIKKEEQRKQCGTYGWAEPELFGKSGNARKPSDVWSTTMLIPHMYYGLEITTRSPKSIDVHREFLKKRNVDIYQSLNKHQSELATLFARGTEWKSNDRPPIYKLLKCFTDNKTLRNLFNTKPNPRMVAPSDNKELSKRLIQNWLYPRTQSRFPLKKPSASAVSDDPTWGMDDMKRNLDEMQDEDVEAILRK